MLIQLVLIFKKLYIVVAALEDAVGYVPWHIYLGVK